MVEITTEETPPEGHAAPTSGTPGIDTASRERRVRPVTDPAPRPVRTSAAAVAITVSCVLPVLLVGGLAAQMSRDLDFSPAGLGLAVSVYFGVSSVASIPTGTLVRRYGPALIARLGILLSALTMLAIAALAHSYALLVVLLAISSTANAFGQLASNVAVARNVPAHRQGLSFGVKQSAIPLSTLLAGAAVPTIALTAGWRWAFVAAGTAALASLAVVPSDNRDPADPTTPPDRGRASLPLVILGVASMLAAAAANALGTFVVDSSVSRGLAPGLAGLTLTLGGAVCFAARILVGWLADRRDHGHVGIIAGMLLVGALGTGLLALSGPAALTVGVLLGFGLGWAWSGLLNFAVVRLHPQAPATATSITQTGVYAGGCVGPLGLGSVAAVAGYPTMWLTAAGAMLVASALMLTGSRALSRR